MTHSFDASQGTGTIPTATVLSFDVEEHFRIEAAAGIQVEPAAMLRYANRMESMVSWLLEFLDGRTIKATFFIVGQIAVERPALVRAIHLAGHEVASHSWEHKRIMSLTPASFREDTRRSKDVLEQTIGARVWGYRAPTFSVVRKTAWAIDALIELGFEYDSSIYPVRHDRYGVRSAPRSPFLLSGPIGGTILELPIATLEFVGLRIPTGGGGYFRLFPTLAVTKTIDQTHQDCKPPVAMLYFHPWEFDSDQEKLPLGTVGRFRTYVGIATAKAKLERLLRNRKFATAIEVVQQIRRQRVELSLFEFSASTSSSS
jgi:polysaccharide deacetylase family protein (PEP-CTERM system associated)